MGNCSGFNCKTKVVENVIIENPNNIILQTEKKNSDSNQIYNKKERLSNSKISINTDYTIEFKNKLGEIKSLQIKIFEDGSKYEGQIFKGKMFGLGKLSYQNSDSYQGEWKNDKRHGKGIFIKYKVSKYEGYFFQFLIFLFDLKISLLKTIEFIFFFFLKKIFKLKFLKGNWENDFKHGNGVEIWDDGNTYEGSYVLGKLSGFGKFSYVNNSKYEGNFKNNQLEGKGTFYWPNGIIYDGEWKNNKMNGFGITFWPDGRKYEGNYKDDIKEGYGKYKRANGKIYEGSNFFLQIKNH